MDVGNRNTPESACVGIFGGGKQLHPGRLIGSELLHQLPCRTLDNLNLGIVIGDTHMAEDFLSDLFAGAHRFGDLDPGPIDPSWHLWCHNEGLTIC